MPITIDCFKAYDVRGQIPNQLNADVCYRIGNAAAEFLDAKTVVVGRDMRLSSPEFAEARTALEQSVALSPTYVSARMTLGKVYQMEGRLDDAIVHLNVARELDPNNAAVYSNLATAYRRQGNWLWKNACADLRPRSQYLPSLLYHRAARPGSCAG